MLKGIALYGGWKKNPAAIRAVFNGGFVRAVEDRRVEELIETIDELLIVYNSAPEPARQMLDIAARRIWPGWRR